MNNDLSTPWYRSDLYGQDLPQRIRHAITISERDRRQSLCDALVAQFAYERERWRYHERGVFDGAPRTGYTQYLRDQVAPALNQIRGLVDKLGADMIRATPGLTIQTSNGRFEDRVQDKIRSRLLQGMLDRPDFGRSRKRWMMQGLLERVGWIMPRYTTGSLDAVQLQQYQVYYDARGAMFGDLDDIHVVELQDRHDLLRWYDGIKAKIPGKAAHRKAIEDAPRERDPMPGASAWLGAYRASLVSDDTGDRVRVARSWRKSWRAGEADGRATITLLPNDGSRTATIIDQPFARASLPVIPFAPWPTSHGIDGISITDSMIVTDASLAFMMHRVDKMMRNHGSDRLVLPRGMPPDIKAQYAAAGFEVVDDPGGDESDGTPRWFKGYKLDESTIAYMDYLMSRPSGLLGFTPQAVQGEDAVAPGASGVARIQAKFQAVGRHLGEITEYTTANRRLGEEVLNAVDDALAIDPGFRASYSDGGRMMTAPWSRYAQASESRRVVVAEVGVLGDSPAGQLQTLQEFAGTGIVPAEAAAQFIADQPDVQRLVGAVFAPREAIQRHLSILSDPSASGQWQTAQPTEDMDLNLAVQLATQTINAAIADDGLPETINRLRAYSMAAQSVRDVITPAAAAPVGPSV